MLPNKYDVGETIFELLNKISHLEKAFGVNTFSDDIIMNNVTIRDKLTLSYATSRSTLFVEPDKSVTEKQLASIITGTANQIIIDDIGDGQISVRTPQDISIESDTQFNNLNLFGSLLISTADHSPHQKWGTEIIGLNDFDATVSIQKSDNSDIGSCIVLRKSNGTLIDPTSVVQGDLLGLINFAGYNGTEHKVSSAIYGIATENHNPDANGTGIVFQTTPLGTSYLTDQLRIDHDGTIYVYSTINSTDTTIGSLIIKGGVGVGKSITVGGNLSIDGIFVFQEVYLASTTQSTSISTGALTVPGGCGIGKSLYIGCAEEIQNTADSSSTDTGSLIVSGGMSVVKSLFIGETMQQTGVINYDKVGISSIINATDESTGALRVNGGVSIAKDLYVEGDMIIGGIANIFPDSLIKITSTIDTSSYSTGSLIINGGTGISKNVHIGGTISMGHTNNDTSLIKFPMNNNGSSYLSNTNNSVMLSYNGYNDGGMWTGFDTNKIASYCACLDGIANVGVGLVQGGTPRIMMGVDNGCNLIMYYPNPIITDNSVMSRMMTDNNGTFNIITTGKQVNFGNSESEIGDFIKFSINSDEYGYVSNNTNELNISANGYWSGTSWIASNGLYGSSCVTLTDGLFKYAISTSAGNVPRLMGTIDNTCLFKLYYADTFLPNNNSIYSSLRVENDGALFISSTGHQINLGALNNNNAQKIQFAVGPKISTNNASIDPKGYIIGDINSILCGYNYKNDGGAQVMDLGQISSCINCADYGIEIDIGVANGTVPRKTLTLDKSGIAKIYYQHPTQNNNSNYTNLSTDSLGELNIYASGGNIKVNSMLNSTNTTNCIGASTGAVQVTGGLGSIGGIIINGALDIQNNFGATCNSFSANAVIKNNLLLWDSTQTGSNSDSYFKFDLFNTSGDSRGLKIDWDGNPNSSVNINMPLIITKSPTDTICSYKNKYSNSIYSSLILDSAGKLSIGSTGNIINFMTPTSINILNTTNPIDSTSGALTVGGGVICKSGMYVGGYYAANPSIEQFMTINDDLMVWNSSSGITDAYFTFNLQDKQIEIENDNRSLVISGNNEDDGVFADCAINVLGHINPLQTNNWFILVYSLVGGAYNCTTTLDTSDGRKSELIMTASSGVLLDMGSREVNFNSTQSGQLVIVGMYLGNTFGNMSNPTQYQYVATYATQTFTAPITTNQSKISFWMYTDNQPFSVTVTLYDGIGTGGTVKSKSSVCVTKTPKQVDCLFPGATAISNGAPYTVSINGIKGFYVGSTYSGGATTFYIGGILQTDKLMCYTVEHSTVLTTYAILGRRQRFGTTYNVHVEDTNAVITCIDTNTSNLYSPFVYYDTLNPSQYPSLTLSENVSVNSGVESTSTSTGSLIVDGGAIIDGNLHCGALIVNNTNTSTSTSTGALIVSGGIGCGEMINTGNINCYGDFYINDALQFNYHGDQSKYGAIKYNNGIGLTFGATSSGILATDSSCKFYVSNVTPSTSQSTGALICYGGVSVAKSTLVSGTNDSNNVSTGSLVASGGVGISGDVYVGGDVYVNENSIGAYFDKSQATNIYNDDIFSLDLNTSFSHNAWQSCCYSPQVGIYLFCGYLNNYALRSYDGINFTSFTFAPMYFIDWFSDSFKFIALGDTSPYGFWSSDGNTWTSVTLGSGMWRKAIWSQALKIFVAVSMSTTNSCATSSDGMTWVTNTGLDVSGVEWIGVCFSERSKLFVAVSRNNKIATSVNGTIWNIITITGIFYDICWSPELSMFVIVGDNVVIVSWDGSTWLRISDSLIVSGVWKKVIWLPKYHLFASIGAGGKFMSSANGTSWVSTVLPNNGDCSCICHSDALKQIAITQTSTQSLIISHPIYEKTVAAYTGDSTSVTSGSIVAYGGCGIAGNLNVGGKMNILQTTVSTSYTSGALIISGGIGVSDSIYLNGNLNIGSNSIMCTNLSIKNVPMSMITGILTGTWTGPLTIAKNIKYTKIGSTVTIYSDVFTQTAVSTNIFYYNTNLPLGMYNTSTNIYVPCRCVSGVSGTVGTVGVLYIATDGGIQIWNGANTTNTFLSGHIITISFSASFMV